MADILKASTLVKKDCGQLDAQASNGTEWKRVVMETLGMLAPKFAQRLSEDIELDEAELTAVELRKREEENAQLKYFLKAITVLSWHDAIQQKTPSQFYAFVTSSIRTVDPIRMFELRAKLQAWKFDLSKSASENSVEFHTIADKLKEMGEPISTRDLIDILTRPEADYPEAVSMQITMPWREKLIDTDLWDKFKEPKNIAQCSVKQFFDRLGLIASANPKAFVKNETESDEDNNRPAGTTFYAYQGWGRGRAGFSMRGRGGGGTFGRGRAFQSQRYSPIGSYGAEYLPLCDICGVEHVRGEHLDGKSRCRFCWGVGHFARECTIDSDRLEETRERNRAEVRVAVQHGGGNRGTARGNFRGRGRGRAGRRMTLEGRAYVLMPAEEFDESCEITETEVNGASNAVEYA